jgi:hypothetical protein
MAGWQYTVGRGLTVEQLFFSGALQADIAGQLGISQPTVSRYLKAAVDRWAVETTEEIREHKKRELCKLDTLELEYWEAWRAGKKNFHYLQGLISCSERRCKILGIEAPKKHDLTTGGDKFEAMTKEQLAAFIIERMNQADNQGS